MKQYPEEALAVEHFDADMNCAQSVFLAFAEAGGLDRDTALRLSSSFGGGLGGQGEVCGALSGAAMAAGLLFGGYTPGDAEGKAAHYDRIKRLGEGFRAEAGSLLCRDLKKEDPEQRKQVCSALVALAARLLAREKEESLQ